MPRVTIDKMRGVNSSRASLQLPPGDFQWAQNVRQRPVQNFAKRKGVEPVDSFTSAVMGIVSFEFDDGSVIPLIQSGDTLTFFPSEYPLADNTNPFNSTPVDPLDDDGVYRSVLWLIEPQMRAISERNKLVHSLDIVWPASIFNADGTTKTTAEYPAPVGYPVNNFYRYDLAWADEKGYNRDGITVVAGSASGTFATALVNLVRSYINISGFYEHFVCAAALVDDIADIPYWTATPALTNTWTDIAAATTGTYRQIAIRIKEAIRNCYIIGIGTTFTGIVSGSLKSKETVSPNTSAQAEIQWPSAQTRLINLRGSFGDNYDLSYQDSVMDGATTPPAAATIRTNICISCGGSWTGGGGTDSIQDWRNYGKIRCDLTAYSGVGYAWFQIGSVTAFTSGPAGYFTGAKAFSDGSTVANVTTSGYWAKWSGGTFNGGSLNTTGNIIPNFITPVNAWAELEFNWGIAQCTVVFYPTFTYYV